MKRLFESSFDTFAWWYLEREMREKGTPPPPVTPEARRLAMWDHHSGKMIDWFSRAARWCLVELESIPELETLVILRCDWTRAEGLPRTLGLAATHAIRSSYFTTPGAGRERHHAYHQRFMECPPTFRSRDRVVLRTLYENERGEARDEGVTASYYLHDGLGRLLPGLTLIRGRRLPFRPIEAFLAEKLRNRLAHAFAVPVAAPVVGGDSWSARPPRSSA